METSMSIFLLLLQLYLTVIWTASTFCFCFYDKNFYFNSFVFHIAHASHSVVKSRLFRMPCSLFRNGLECSLMTQNVVITPQIDKIHFCLHTSLLLYCIYVNCVGVWGCVYVYDFPTAKCKWSPSSRSHIISLYSVIV